MQQVVFISSIQLNCEKTVIESGDYQIVISRASGNIYDISLAEKCVVPGGPAVYDALKPVGGFNLASKEFNIKWGLSEDTTQFVEAIMSHVLAKYERRIALWPVKVHVHKKSWYADNESATVREIHYDLGEFTFVFRDGSKIVICPGFDDENYHATCVDEKGVETDRGKVRLHTDDDRERIRFPMILDAEDNLHYKKRVLLASAFAECKINKSEILAL